MMFVIMDTRTRYIPGTTPPPTVKYSSMRALHTRCLSLSDFFETKNHVVGCDLLYTLAKFCRSTYKNPNQVLVHGV